MAENIRDMMLEMAGQIEGLTAVGVMGMDGVPIASYVPPGSKMNMELASAQFAQVMKLVQTSVDKVGVGELEDNLITTSNGYVLTRALGDGSAYLGIVTTGDGILGMMRLVAKSYAERLYDAIPGRGKH
jgi:predicted regulator of Ras-like GTPase activity (Roadblock/LC7/MglB family)